MCGPFAALAFTGASGLLKYLGNKKSENAQQRRLMEERRRQEGFTAQQQGHFEDSLAHTKELQDPEAQRRAAGARNSALAAAVAPATGEGSYLPGASSAPSVVRTASDRSSGQRFAESSGLAAALAKLGGFGDQILSTNIASGRNAGRINQIGSFKAGSSGVLDSELSAAAHKGDTLRGIGEFIAQAAAAAAGAPGAGGIGSSPGISASILNAKNPFMMPKGDLAALLSRLPVAV